MFFGEELLGKGSQSLERMKPRRRKHFGSSDFNSLVKKKEVVHDNFYTELSAQSIDTILKKYTINPFFKIKLDLLLA